MQVLIEKSQIVFSSTAGCAGRYILDDRFKPYIHPLKTPKGHVVTVALPHDHRHHKGLMYALRFADLNFWEEDPGSGACGIQEILKTEPIANGFSQSLLWKEEHGTLQTYEELRTITCQLNELSSAYVWSWRSQRNALRPHRLIKSPWSREMENGRLINYHGLGIRLPWGWSFSGESAPGIESNGQDAYATDTCGSSASKVGMRGPIDGHWSPPIAAVTIKQDGDYGWFVLKEGFPYLSVGPSNLREIDVGRGQEFDEHFQIIVEDR
ncbi:MAG: DUF6807 family protein [Verrucomicrobiota bacterium]